MGGQIIIEESLMRYRSYRGSRRSNGGSRPVVQSFKKVLNIVPASYTAGFTKVRLANGQDSVAAGQTGNTDDNVPTGSIIKYIEIQFSAVNLVAAACYINTTLGYLLAGQVAKDPLTIGGNTQRNQILHQSQFVAGLSQNANRTFKFKIPKKFQRLRENMEWVFTWNTSASVSASIQVIYKFYR